MDGHSLSFLKTLLDTPGPSGNEAGVSKIWRDEARAFADDVYADVQGNSFAVLNGDGPRILLAGHIDEIGVVVSYIDENGFLSFQPLGGWDAQVLVGQRIRLLGTHGPVIGVIGKRPIHLMEADDRSKASKLKDLWIDIGVKSRMEAEDYVRVGTVGVIDVQPHEMPNGRIVSRSIDNRIGAYTVLEALRLLSNQRPTATVAAIATTQEETSLAGAKTATFRFDPHIALVVDVTFATDHPFIDVREHGDIRLGNGPVLSRGAGCSPLVYERLLAVAQEEGLPYQISVSSRYSGTDADVIHMERAGVATGLISVPNRYMHSPNEMVTLSDLDHVARLIAAFVRSVQSEMDFVPAP
jgi:endoglucanase